MTVTYDPEADAVYIALRQASVARSSDAEEGIVFDYDKDGGVVGIEVLRASQRTDDPRSIQYALAAGRSAPEA